MKPIRVLQVVTSMNMGGIENFLMSYYRHMDRTQVQFDFLKHRDTHDLFDDEILSMGGKIYAVPRINPLRQYHYAHEVRRFFQTHNTYKIIHSHLNTFSAYPLRFAKEAGIPVRIAHAHAVTTKLDFRTPFRLYTKAVLPRYYTDAFACSKAGGAWLFRGKPYQLWPNAIDTNVFTQNTAVREQVRAQMHLQNAYVIGMVANFSPIKNHSFILRVFAALCQTEPNAVLLLVGDGVKKADVQRQAMELRIADKVIFTGVRTDTDRLLQAMDVFVLPSISEGFSISALEAESVGLPCVLSAGIPRDVKLFPEMQTVFLDISSIEPWVQELLALKNYPKKDWAQEIRKTPYDIENSAKQLAAFYLNRSKSVE